MNLALLAEFPMKCIRVFWDRYQGNKAPHQGLWTPLRPSRAASSKGQAHPSTIVFVMHGIEEAIFLADRIEIMSPSPGRVRHVLDLDLPRPRDTTSPAFGTLVRTILGHIHDDISLIARA